MNQTPKVTILIGLPGAGKSKYLDANFHDYCLSHRSFDDFHKDAKGDSTAFDQSQSYEPLKKKLQEGKDCVISDVEYCRCHRLTQAKEALEKLFHQLNIPLRIEYLYLENNPNACRHNVVDRFNEYPSRDYLSELAKIDCLSAVYTIPPEHQPIPVKTCCSKVGPGNRY